MAKIVGRNALVYLNGAVAPNRNSTTITYNQEMQEARVYQDAASGNYWSDQIPGFSGWTMNLNGYYDDGNSMVTDTLTSAATSQLVIVYETRSGTGALGRYWYGQILINSFTEEIGVDDVITLNISGTGTGPLTRIE